MYIRRRGRETLVFLSGSGTAAPALDFKALYSRLGAAVTGLPWWNGPAMDSAIRPILPGILIQVLDENQEALTLAGESHLIFCFRIPCQVQFIKQISPEVKDYWLDAAVPSFIYLVAGEETLNKSAEAWQYQSYSGGMIRLHPELYDTDPAMTGDILTRREKAAYKAVVMKSFMTKNMVDEVRYAYANAAKWIPGKAGSNSGTLLYIRRFSGWGWRDIVTSYMHHLQNHNMSFRLRSLCS